MTSYILKRLVLAIPVIFGVTTLVFIAVRVGPSDTAQALAGFDTNPEMIAEIRREYGLDRPVTEQFARYISGLIRLDLGRSALTRAPVADELLARFPITLTVAVGAVLFAVLLGVTLGVVAAHFHTTWVDYASMVLALGALSIPNYVLGLLLILLFAVTLGLLPATGASTPRHFILPIVAVGLVGAGVLARQTRSAVIEVLNEDYVRTARAKGLRERTVLVRHALRNALIPLITVVGLLFGALLGGTVIVETVFAIPGVGKYMIDAISNRDYPAVQGGVLLIANSYVFVNLLVDLMYVVADRRVSLK